MKTSRWMLGLGLCLLVALPASGQGTVRTSPDVTLELDASGGGVFADEDVAVDDLLGLTVPAYLGPLVDADEVTGYEWLSDVDQLICFDEAVSLSPTFDARPGDVVRFDSANYSLEFDADAAGVPDGVVCDAVTMDPGGSLLVSFDTTFELTDGGGTTLTIHDEDILRIAGPTTFAIYLDGSAAGIPEGLDLDGAHLDASGDLILSFDVTGTVGGVDFDDDDLARLAVGAGTWSLYLDLATRDPDWVAADADAVSIPEPGLALALLSGAAMLGWMERRRRPASPTGPRALPTPYGEAKRR